MRRSVVVSFLGVIVFFSLACNYLLASGSQTMNPVQLTTTGDRTSFSGDYACQATDSVLLYIDKDGIATLSITGIVFVDYINCTPDASGFQATYTLMGLADPDSWLVVFTSCNEGGFSAEGTISYRDNKPVGSVSCTRLTGPDAGKVAMHVWIPSGDVSFFAPLARVTQPQPFLLP
ncbi:MAG: hypothetical protein HY869_05800 [Chloroflexi bacterium]|nr:hypothetical protein [Chloroflexota bacterium]